MVYESESVMNSTLQNGKSSGIERGGTKKEGCVEIGKKEECRKEKKMKRMICRKEKNVTW